MPISIKTTAAPPPVAPPPPPAAPSSLNEFDALAQEFNTIERQILETEGLYKTTQEEEAALEAEVKRLSELVEAKKRLPEMRQKAAALGEELRKSQTRCAEAKKTIDELRAFLKQ